MSFVSFELAGKPTFGIWENEQTYLQVPSA
jgi:hypothetical protein